jgi:hypothetical protein
LIIFLELLVELISHCK